MLLRKAISRIKLIDCPNASSAGTVASPKIAIIAPPVRGDAQAAAFAAKKKTNPHGNNPFIIPKAKKLRILLLRIKREKRSLKRGMLENELSREWIIDEIPSIPNAVMIINAPANRNKAP